MEAGLEWLSSDVTAPLMLAGWIMLPSDSQDICIRNVTRMPRAPVLGVPCTHANDKKNQCPRYIVVALPLQMVLHPSGSGTKGQDQYNTGIGSACKKVALVYTSSR